MLPAGRNSKTHQIFFWPRVFIAVFEMFSFWSSKAKEAAAAPARDAASQAKAVPPPPTPDAVKDALHGFSTQILIDLNHAIATELLRRAQEQHTPPTPPPAATAAVTPSPV